MAKLIIPIVANGRNLIGFAIVQISMRAKQFEAAVDTAAKLCHSSISSMSIPFECCILFTTIVLVTKIAFALEAFPAQPLSPVAP